MKRLSKCSFLQKRITNWYKPVTLLLVLIAVLTNWVSAQNTLGTGYLYNPQNRAVIGTYEAYQDAAYAPTCVDNMYYYLRFYGSSEIQTVCPYSNDMNRKESKMSWIQYQNNNGSWWATWAGEIILYHQPYQVPSSIPEKDYQGKSIVGAMHGYTIPTFQQQGYNWVQYSGNWSPIAFTLSDMNRASQPAPVPPSQPTPEPNDGNKDCHLTCDKYCKKNGKSGGKFIGDGVCLLGLVERPSSECLCW